jgi:hypothetical protein
MKKNKTTTAIALFLMFAMAVSIVALTLPTANAQSTEYYSGSYYSWPVDEQNLEWQKAYIAEQTDGPLTAHIRWVRPFAIGGVAGGEISGEHAFDIGDAYAGKWSTRSIVGGIAYNILDPVVSPTVTLATDIRTGEELWRSSTLGGSPFAQMILTKYGLQRYLWRSVSGSSGGNAGTVYSAYDPWTLQWVFNITNVLSGTRTTGENGEFILYSASTTGGYMTYWNQSWMLEQPGVIEALARDRTVNMTTYGYTANWTIPVTIGSIREYRWGDKVVGTYESGSTTVMWAFSLKAGEEGTLLYNKTAVFEIANYTGNLGIETLSNSISVRLLGDTPEESSHLHYIGSGDWKYWAYSYDNGTELWKSTDFAETADGELYLNQYDRSTLTGSWADGTAGWLYTAGVSGIVYAYHATKGLAWAYHAADPYQEILWGNDWWMHLVYDANGKVYASTEEHSPIDPLPRGGPFLCLNATTGDVVWRADGLFRGSHWGGRSIIGSGVILTQDTYDQRTYCIGKGPTSTTVTTPDAGVPSGSTAIIRGTVMDISPGCSNDEIQLRFPNGVPAVCDANMSAWMRYVYKNMPRPIDAVGVDVVLTVLDSDGQVFDTATVTTDAYGFFSYELAAEDAGEYSVKASFAGSDSYYGSFAVSDPFTVMEAPEPTAAPTPMPESVADAYFVPAVAGILVALVVVGAVLVLLLRKR